MNKLCWGKGKKNELSTPKGLIYLRIDKIHFHFI